MNSSMAVRYLVPSQANLWQALRRLARTAVVSNGKPLFCAGEPAHGIYLVESGKVHLHIWPRSKAQRPFEIAGPGSVLGLSESMTGEDYKLAAEPEPGARVSFVDRDALLACLRADQRICFEVVRSLSESLHNLYYHLRQINGARLPPKKRASAVH